MSRRLVKIVCRVCGRHLCDVIPGAEVWCPDCDVWMEAKRDCRSQNADCRLAERGYHGSH